MFRQSLKQFLNNHQKRLDRQSDASSNSCSPLCVGNFENGFYDNVQRPGPSAHVDLILFNYYALHYLLLCSDTIWLYLFN